MSLNDYRAEFAAVRKALESTVRDLETDLVNRGLRVEAARVDEAAAFVKATFRSLDLTLAKAQAKGHR